MVLGKVLVWLGLRDELDDILNFFTQIDNRLDKVLTKLSVEKYSLHDSVDKARREHAEAIADLNQQLDDIVVETQNALEANYQKAIRAANTREAIRTLCSR